MKGSERHTGIMVSGHEGPIAMRNAEPEDAKRLERLAQLDSHPPLHGTVLVAEVRGELRAARSLRTGETIADPFQHTAHLRELLSTQAAQLAPSERRGRFAIGWRRLYARAEA